MGKRNINLARTAVRKLDFTNMNVCAAALNYRSNQACFLEIAKLSNLYNRVIWKKTRRQSSVFSLPLVLTQHAPVWIRTRVSVGVSSAGQPSLKFISPSSRGANICRYLPH